MILVLLPILCWVFIALIFNKKGLCWRSSFLAAAICWGVLLTGITEILSIVKLLTLGSLLVVWGLATVIISLGYYFISRQESTKSSSNRRLSFTSMPVFPRCLLAGVVLIVILTGLTASIAPPNNWDSMTYHMSRVMHWIQNQGVGHYPAHILRQLHSNPWSEFAITHFQILNGGDYLANFVQWFSMVGCILGVTLIAERFGANLRGQIFAAVVLATLPMGILQASSTQNDYVTSFWLVCFVYYCIMSMQQPNLYYSLGVGTSLGLAILTKGTAYIYAFPFLVWLCWSMVKILRLRICRPVLIISVVVLLINIGHYSRNLELFRNPLGPDAMSPAKEYTQTNDVFTVSSIVSNILRNAGLHMGTPIKLGNAAVEKGICSAHSFLGIDLNDPRTTWTGTRFHINTLSAHEDSAGNPIHLVLILLAIFIIIFFWKNRKEPYLKGYIIALVAAFLLFCMSLKWQPWHSRLHLSLFVLWSPVIAVIMSNAVNKWIANVIMAILVITSFHWVLKNESRPLVGQNSILNTSRIDQYFSNRPGIKESYYDCALAVSSQQCNDIGLQLGGDHWEYPLWVLIQRSSKQIPRIEHVYVGNNSYKISLGNFKPCTLLKTDKNGKMSVSILDQMH